MSSRAKQIAEAGAHLKVDWEASQWPVLERGLAAKVSRRTLRRRAAAMASLVLVAFVGVSFAIVGNRRAAAPAPVARTAHTSSEAGHAAAVQLRDGSQLEASSGADWLERAPDAAVPQRIELEVGRGKLRLSVVPHQPGEFRVRAGDVLVEVIGTILSVERQGDSVSVAVERGLVKVTRGAETPTFLNAGERRTFHGASDVNDVGGAPSAGAPTPAPGSPALAPESSWQALAREGEYAAAYGKLQLDTVADVPGDLLLAADVARLSGHPAQAVVPLRRVTQRHAADPRAPLAAFTLGRVYLDDLGNPRDAALAFRSTRSLQPGGPMVELALAREAEAWARAGETQKAKTLAREYLTRYPGGTKRKLVQRLADEP